MSLPCGTKLGPYEIQSPLGAGGMGEVYRARDTRLGRDVAVKVLPTHLASDPDLKARFEREARAISALQHPHICTLHDLGHEAGIDYLVMEFLEGETLQQRLLRGALPVKQAVDYGIEVAEALDRAHQAGLIHRDLKPGNIMLTKSGAKLLDFGLAKPVAAMAVARATGSLSSSTPTMTIASMTEQPVPLTQRGTVVGTFEYVAPEVLQGNDADARSDVFALGAVLYEMLTGKRAFEGKSHLSIMTAILEKEPEPMAAVSPALEHVVHTCLAKEPGERWQSAREVARELRWVKQSNLKPRPDQGATTTRRRSQVVWIAVVLAAMGMTFAATYYATRSGPGPRWTVSVLLPTGMSPATTGRNGPPQISPDGSRVAFIGCPTAESAGSLVGSNACAVWLQSLRSREVHEITGTNGSNAPFWSPDGKEIAFFNESKLKAVPADGGPIRIICDAQDGRGGSWGSSEMILFSPSRGGPIFRVPAEGGSPVPLTSSSLESNIALVGSHRWAHFLPDGQHFVYSDEPNGACNNRAEIHFASMDGKQDHMLLHVCSNVSYANGRLIYWRDGNLIAQPFDPRRGILSGTPIAIADHVAFDALFGFGAFSASTNGELLYRTGDGAIKAGLVWCDRKGKQVGTLGESDKYSDVAISPDGSRVVADTVGGTNNNILLLDARGTRTLLSAPSTVMSPVWSSDGRRIYFAANPNGPFDVYVKEVDSSASEQPLAVEKAQNVAMFPTVSRDGKYLAYISEDPATKRLRIHIVHLTGDRTPRVFRSVPANEMMPSFSPDGTWLAYESDQSGKEEVYVSPFPSGSKQYQISTNGGERPVWRRDGKEIYYRSGLRMMAVKVIEKGSAVELGTPEVLFEVAVRNLAGRWYDVSPDGRFLMNTAPAGAQAQNFDLVLNWPVALNR